MPIPFQDTDENEITGNAAYLKIENCPMGFRGALFQINSRGEPVEFTYTSLPVPHSFLWRQSVIKRQAARKITASLFALCPHIPRLILCLAGEISSDLFVCDLKVSIPVCRIALDSNNTNCSSPESRQELNQPQPVCLLWFPSLPPPESVEYRLFNRLVSADLLLEPFERASAGLKEVYK